MCKVLCQEYIREKTGGKSSILHSCTTPIEQVSHAGGFNTVARQYALDYLNKEAVLERFEADLQALVS